MSEVVGIPIPFQTEVKTLIRARATDFVNRIPNELNRVAVTFDFDPKGSAFTYVAGPNAYTLTNAWRIPIDEPITFTANVITPPGVEALEYRWDFGDGGYGYGNPIEHSFSFVGARPVTLQVTDSRNRRTFAQKRVYLTDYSTHYTPPVLLILPPSSLVSLSSETVVGFFRHTCTTYSKSLVKAYEFGTTTSYGNEWSAGTQPPWTTTTESTVIPAALVPNTTYHIRLRGVDDVSTYYSNDLTFTTPPVS